MNGTQRRILKLLQPVFGKKSLQKIFENLMNFSHFGLNYGLGGDFTVSGEKFLLNHLKQQFSKSARDQYILFDVGANIGDYTFELAKEFSHLPHRIYSFEPNPQTFQTLKNNVENYSNVEIFDLGLGEKDDTMELFYEQEENSVLASLYNRNLETINIDFKYKKLVNITSLDAFCKEHNIPAIDFLKLDVEGHELKVLEGAKEMMENNKIRSIQFEFGSTNVDSRTFFKDFYYLLIDKYNIYRILKNGLQPITRYTDNLEIFKTTNFYAALKS